MRLSKIFGVLTIIMGLSSGSLHAIAAETKAVNAKTKTTGVARPRNVTFMPTAQDLSDAAASAPADTKKQEIKDSRWVEYGQLKSTDKEKTTGASSKFSLIASCTDTTGKTFASTDDGYTGCIQQLSASLQKAQARSDIFDDRRSTSDKEPTARTGIQFKLGD